MNLQAIVRIKTCCRVSENFVRNFVFLCICCNFRLSILGFLVSAGHAFVKIRPLLLSTFYKTRNETRWLMGNIIYIYISLQRARQNFPVKCLWKKKKIQNIYTINDLVNTRGVYLILGVQARAFKRERRIITVTISKKLIYFRRNYQESLKTAEYPLLQLIHLGRLEIHIALWNPSINVRILAHCYCVVIVSLSLL